MITKIAGVICRGRSVLAVRKAGDATNTYILPGGKPEGSETPLETLRRELREELDIEVAHAEPFGATSARSALEPEEVEMTIFDVEVHGDPKPSGEICELRWLGRDAIGSGLSMGSVLEAFVMPLLMDRGRI